MIRHIGIVSALGALVALLTLGCSQALEMPQQQTCSDGSTIAVGQDCPVPDPVKDPEPPKKDPARGLFTLPGIDRIPLDALQINRKQLATMYAIIEQENTVAPTHPAYNHGVRVSATACHSYILACDPQDTPFTMYWKPLEDLLAFQKRVLPETTRLLSLSVGNGSGQDYAKQGTNYPSYSTIRGAGNEGQESFFLPGTVTEQPGHPGREATIATAKAHKVLFVAGYVQEDDGSYTRDPLSTGCTDIAFGCIYAPFSLELPEHGLISGTSISTPIVASALASVLALFPDLSGTDLVRLAKACAIPTPSLNGHKRADFSCMTTEQADGSWKVITRAEVTALINSIE